MAKAKFRRDIEGLRAFALILVVFYHGGVNLLPGSYIGVDLFFVISGFLITGLLMAETSKTGTISLKTFYARRLRRLVPAATVVLVATLIAAKLLLPPLLLTEVAKDGVATALNLTNMWLGWTGTDYLSDPTPSLFQHYWSLAVEEQFYLLWPIIILLAARKPSGRVRRTTIVIASIVAVSFVLCVAVTSVARGWAYFLLPTRAWELGAGALLAMFAPQISKMPTSAKVALSWAGLVGILVAAFFMDRSMAFPGWLALAPVLGALAIISGDGTPNGVQRFLGLEFMQFIGRISYSFYMWHWPLLILPSVYLNRSLTLPEGLAMVLLAGVLGWATFRWVEKPVRSHSTLVAKRHLNFALGAGLVVVTLAASLLTARLPQMSTDTAVASPSASEISTGTEFPAFVPSNVSPPLVDSAGDIPAVYADGCEADFAETRTRACIYGDQNAESSVVLFGDSRASQWFPALERFASDRNLRLVTMTKSACPAADIEVDAYLLDRSFPECDAFRADAVSKISQLRPALVVMSGYAGGYSELWRGTGSYEQAYADGLTETIAQLPADTKVVTLGDTPTWPQAPAVCLSGHVRDTADCTIQTSDAVDQELEARQAEAAAMSNSAFVAPSRWLCGAELCYPLAGNELLYRDDRHITDVAALRLEPLMSSALSEAMAGVQP